MTITAARLAGGSRPRPGMAEAISAEHLTKTYPRRGRSAVRALDDVSLTVPTGTILGLLGPNGAGKSTTVKILTTLAAADSGRAVVAGLDVAARPADVRRAIGYVPQKSSFDPMGTGRENLVLQGRVQGLPASQARTRAEQLLAGFALTDAADRLVRTWSGGMARKLDVALGLVHRPAVLFLDEPTTGLDPQARTQMWAELTALAELEGLTILLTTHYLEEADRLAEHLVVIDAGRVVATGTPDELKSQLDGDTLSFDLAVGLDGEVDAEAADRVRRVLAEQGIALVSLDGVRVRARAGGAAARLPRLLAALAAAGVELASVTVARPSLDDVYLHHTGRSFETAASPEVAK